MAESYVTNLTMLDEGAILADLNRIATELGLITQINQTSHIYIYYAVFARVMGNITQLVAQYINALDIENTTDEALLDILIKPFVKKQNATVSKVILEFSRRVEDDNAVDIFIPRNVEVMTEGSNPIIFRTAESKILWKDSWKVKVPAYSVEFGSINNLAANTLTYFKDSQYASISVTNPDPAYGGRDEETAFDARNRLEWFRSANDGTREYIQKQLFNNGVSYYGFNIVEYWEGSGTALIAIDVPSEEEFYDIIQNMEITKKSLAEYHYCRVQYIYINISVNVKITGDRLYSEYQKEDIYQTIETAVQLFFNQNIFVGKKLSINRLEAFILQYMIDERYEIYEIGVSIAMNHEYNVDPETGQIVVEEFEKLVPNKIRTRIEYNIN